MHHKDQYAVIGNPIGHSKSPLIHALFAEQTGQHMEYHAILGEVGAFAEAAQAFRDDGGRGMNVTVPFKTDAWAFADRLSPGAERAGAVNTLMFGDDVYGDNTDGPGLVRDLTANRGLNLGEHRILLLGAGGAARGVMAPLMTAGPRALVIANRTVDRAHELVLRFSDLGQLRACGLEELAGERFDLIINGTAAGLDDAVPSLPDDILEPGGACYDMVYGDQPTAFMRWAWARGAGLACDGLGMLVEQAAESFQIWRGVRPDTGPVLAALMPGRR